MKLITKLNKWIHFDCIYGLSGRVLYESENLTTNYTSSSYRGVLKDSIKNYKRLKVFAYINGYNVETEVYLDKEGLSGSVSCVVNGGTCTSTNYLYFPVARITFNDVSFTVDRKYQTEFSAQSNNVLIAGVQAKVCRIVGFKY